MNYNFNQNALRISYSLYIVITKFKVCLFTCGKRLFSWKLKRKCVDMDIFSTWTLLRRNGFSWILDIYLWFIYYLLLLCVKNFEQFKRNAKLIFLYLNFLLYIWFCYLNLWKNTLLHEFIEIMRYNNINKM